MFSIIVRHSFHKSNMCSTNSIILDYFRILCIYIQEFKYVYQCRYSLWWLIYWMYIDSYCCLLLGPFLSLNLFVYFCRCVLNLIGEPFSVIYLYDLFCTIISIADLHLWWLHFRLLGRWGQYDIILWIQIFVRFSCLFMVIYHMDIQRRMDGIVHFLYFVVIA